MTRHLYRIGGVELQSEIALPSLAPVEEASPSREGVASEEESARERITLRAGLGPVGEPARWLYSEQTPETEELWRAVGIVSDGHYLVRLFGHADFELDRGGRTARAILAPGADARVLEPLFLEQALPLFWSLLGRPCLHASAVVWPAGGARGEVAVAFAGRSRSGKSTLAGALVQQGAGALLADDCLPIELTPDSVLAHPGHRSVRLLADSAEALFARADAGEASADGGKRRLDLQGGARAVPLARVYLLEPLPADTPTPEPVVLRARDAIAQLASCLFRIDPEDRAGLAAELSLLGELARRTVVARLGVPRRFSALADVRAAVSADLRRE
ncbi:MAG: hypothetical protein R3F14_01685 [Polyangiaceae bacterium]